MRPDIPRFRESRPFEAPDGYLVEGERVTPISRIDDELQGCVSLADAPLSPEMRAQIANVENAMPALRAIAEVERVHANMPRSPFPPVTTIDAAAHRVAVTDSQVAALDDAERALRFRS
jgi:hypothetical protein